MLSDADYSYKGLILVIDHFAFMPPSTESIVPVMNLIYQAKK
jgi:hypothetical protein